MDTKNKRFAKRVKRVRGRIFGMPEKPRLAIFRSNKFIYGQIIDDTKGKTLAAVAARELAKKGIKAVVLAALSGEEIAKKAKAKKIKRIVFDRRGYKYHGQVKAFAEGARKGGLEF